MVETRKVRILIYVDDAKAINSHAFDSIWRADVSLKEILDLCEVAIKEIE